MYEKEGVKGFFKGNGVNVVRIAPFSAFQFFFYEFFKHTLYHGASPSDFTSKIVCGGLTGCVASTLTYPLDLIRTKLSVQVESEATEGMW